MTEPASPEGLQPKYLHLEPNTNITLSTATATVTFSTQYIEIEGNIIFTFRPSPIVEFVGEEIKSSIDLFTSYVNNTLDFRVHSFPKTEWVVTDLSPFRAYANPNFIESPPASNLEFIQFLVLNFDEFIGTPIERKGKKELGRVVLQAKGWKITIDSLQSTKQAIQRLKKEGGYGVTHIGKLERENNEVFSSSEGKEYLAQLMDFLSFARGLWTTIILLEGFAESDQLDWINWGCPSRTSSWRIVYSWNDGRIAREVLPEVYRGFIHLTEQNEWRTVLPQIIYWYILSNTLKNVDGALILAQTILELLSWSYLVNQTRKLGRNEFDRLKAFEKFRRLLTNLNIPVGIPKGLAELSKMAAGASNIDGPQTITRIRNSLVHPDSGNKNLPSGVYVEALNLSLWYVELVILRLCNFQGNYASRVLGRPRWAGEVEPVPWKAP